MTKCFKNGFFLRKIVFYVCLPFFHFFGTLIFFLPFLGVWQRRWARARRAQARRAPARRAQARRQTRRLARRPARLASRAKGGARQARQALLPRPQKRPPGQRIRGIIPDSAGRRGEFAHRNIGYRVLPQVTPPPPPPQSFALPSPASYGADCVIFIRIKYLILTCMNHLVERTTPEFSLVHQTFLGVRLQMVFIQPNKTCPTLRKLSRIKKGDERMYTQ